MKEKIKSYVDLMFAGAPKTQETDDTKEEILQNTLAHYDDMVSGGMSPEEAYNSAISRIGDINEILSSKNKKTQDERTAEKERIEKRATLSRLMLAIAVCLYICCVIPPIFIRGDLGPCLMFVIIGIATALIIFRPHRVYESEEPIRHVHTARYEGGRHSSLRRSVSSLIMTVGLAAFIILGFTTGAWYILWIIFPLCGAISGLVCALLDLFGKEDK